MEKKLVVLLEQLLELAKQDKLHFESLNHQRLMEEISLDGISITQRPRGYSKVILTFYEEDNE